MFAPEQIKELLKNKNVLRCSPKAITYHPDFKVRAVKRLCDDGIPAARIFMDAGFDLAVIGAKTPKWRLTDWRRMLRDKGTAGLRKDGRGKAKGKGGGRPKTKNLTDKEKIEYLEAKVAYLKAENDFLTKLRAAQKE